MANLIEKDYGLKNDHLLSKPNLFKAIESTQHLRWEDRAMPRLWYEV